MDDNYTTSWIGSTDHKDESGMMMIYDNDRNIVGEIVLESFRDYLAIEKILTSSKKFAFRAGFYSFKDTMQSVVNTISVPKSIWG